MVHIESGSGLLGCTRAQRDYCFSFEKPVRTVYFSNDLQVGVSEVTVGFWNEYSATAFDLKNCEGDRETRPGYQAGSDCPIPPVTFTEAARFANAVSTAEGLQECYSIDAEDMVSWPEGYQCDGYRLPTEAEWEYFARAGSDSLFANGVPKGRKKYQFGDRYTIQVGDEVRSIVGLQEGDSSGDFGRVMYVDGDELLVKITIGTVKNEPSRYGDTPRQWVLDLNPKLMLNEEHYRTRRGLQTDVIVAYPSKFNIRSAQWRPGMMDKVAADSMGSLGNRERVRRDQPNNWGLHDLTGNNSEWVWDGFCDYADLLETDPVCHNRTDEMRAVRGSTLKIYEPHHDELSGWRPDSDLTYYRLTSRSWAHRPFHSDKSERPLAGFRLVRTVSIHSEAD